MCTIAFQITSLTIVNSTVYSGADQRKHQSFASLAFVRVIHRSPMNYRWITAQMVSNVNFFSFWWRHNNICSFQDFLMLPSYGTYLLIDKKSIYFSILSQGQAISPHKYDRVIVVMKMNACDAKAWIRIASHASTFGMRHTSPFNNRAWECSSWSFNYTT